MKDLHVLPKFSDRWSHLYLEHGRLDQEADSLTFHDKEGLLPIPIDQLALVMLGPGTRVSHAAMKALADNNCLVCWVGEYGVRVYAHNTGGTHSSARLLRQIALYCDFDQRRAVALRMYRKRFDNPIADDTSFEQIRGMEGARVRHTYARLAKEHGIAFHGRNYDQGNWGAADPPNRALSSANACLYGLCHAAILSAGYSPAVGFIHTGSMLSFVYDVADLYKTEVTLPAAFRTVAESALEVERRTRLACRDLFYETKLMDRILPDIGEMLDARDDLAERPGEFEGQTLSLVSGAEDWHLLGESEQARAG
jgi:CRISPR-associated protein Cas1